MKTRSADEDFNITISINKIDIGIDLRMLNIREIVQSNQMATAHYRIFVAS